MILKIAIPVVEGHLPGHFGESKQFVLVEADRQNRIVLRTQIIAVPPHEPGSFPRWLREQGVQVLIVGSNGIGQRALDNLVHHGIEVRAGQPGTPIEALVAASLGEKLPRLQEGCDYHHDTAAGEHECPLADYLKAPTPGH